MARSSARSRNVISHTNSDSTDKEQDISNMRTSKRRRLNNGHATSPILEKVFPNQPTAAASEADYKNWKGWCEMESEPAFFNVMQRELGVKDIKVQEVVSLDEEILGFLPQPVYGLIFLFQWQEDNAEKQVSSCPPDVWFANQTVDNACATVALLNILNNIPESNLGEHLTHFKEFTMDFTPPLRGEAIRNYEFIRQIHNSFARKMDMLISDQHLKSQFKDSKKSKKSKNVDDDEVGFHYIAFLPIHGKLWKLDGLERQPQDLGKIGHRNWLDAARPEIEARMAASEDNQIEFSILGVVRDPLSEQIPSLALNIKNLIAVEARMDEHSADCPDWRDSTIQMETTLHGPDLSYGLDAETFAKASVPSQVAEVYKAAKGADIRHLRQRLVDKQDQIRLAIKDEQESRAMDQEKAAGRRHDYGPAIQAWIKFHAERGLVKEFIETSKASD